MEMKKLLPMKRRRSKIDYSEFGPKKRTRAMTSNMNTRSVARKTHNIGATYQAPTNRDEVQWKSWPVHGMHERPVWHPDIGLATEYLGNSYIALDDSYHQVIKSSSCHKRNAKKNISLRPISTSDTVVESKLPPWRELEQRMHKSLHCAFAYCANVASSDTRRTVAGQGRREEKLEVKKRVEPNTKVPKMSTKYCLLAQRTTNPKETGLRNSLLFIPKGQHGRVTLEDKEPSKRKEGLAKSNCSFINFDDTSISDESLMELSSMYVNLAEHGEAGDQSGNEVSANVHRLPNLPQPAMGLKSRMNVEWNSHSSSSKNTAIVTIKDPLLSLTEAKFKKDAQLWDQQTDTNEALDLSTVKCSVEKEAAITNDKQDEDMLNLLQNAAVLYCVTAGVHQDDLAEYINTLDAKQSVEWLQQYINML